MYKKIQETLYNFYSNQNSKSLRNLRKYKFFKNGNPMYIDTYITH